MSNVGAFKFIKSKDHLTNLVRSSCKVSLSASVFTVLNTFVSSANLSTLLHKSSSKSFINIRNNIGTNIDPCGTPFKTSFQFDISPSTVTLQGFMQDKIIASHTCFGGHMDVNC